VAFHPDAGGFLLEADLKNIYIKKIITINLSFTKPYKRFISRNIAKFS